VGAEIGRCGLVAGETGESRTTANTRAGSSGGGGLGQVIFSGTLIRS